MMIEAPYQSEWQLYPLTPPEHRWIYNKLELAARLGDEAYPIGCKIPAGDWCVRPVMNIQGQARGGFRRVTLNEPNFIHGYVGCVATPWSEEPRYYYEFIADKCISAQFGTREGELEVFTECDPAFILPEPLRGISRYLLIETMGSTIIDVGPRLLMEEVKKVAVDDYRQFDPEYNPPAWATTLEGHECATIHFWDEDVAGWRLKDIDINDYSPT